jgi:DNA-directed RNA polymerase subunit RPC12/RpoP
MDESLLLENLLKKGLESKLSILNTEINSLTDNLKQFKKCKMNLEVALNSITNNELEEPNKDMHEASFLKCSECNKIRHRDKKKSTNQCPYFLWKREFKDCVITPSHSIAWNQVRGLFVNTEGKYIKNHNLNWNGLSNIVL